MSCSTARFSTLCELATPLQHDQASRLNRIQAASTGGVRACIRRVAGCATTTGSAGHAGATANLKLTFHLDHSAGADQSRKPLVIPGANPASSSARKRRYSLTLKPGSIPPITYCATDMPAFSAASGSFHVKSSFTNLVTVFVTVRLLPSFSTFTLIRSSTLIVSTFDARSYTDQRYWSIHSSVRMHSSEAASGLTFASGSASGTLMTGSTTVALAPGSASAVLSSGPASAASEWASAAIASREARPALTCPSRFAGATHSSTAKLQHRKQPNPLKSLYLLPILYPLVISSKGKPAVVTLQPELRKFERLAHAKSCEPGPRRR